MITYCQVCTHVVPEKRMRRNSRTCSNECGKVYRAEWLKDRWARVCKRCGNRLPKVSAKQPRNSVPEALRVEVAQ